MQKSPTSSMAASGMAIRCTWQRRVFGGIDPLIGPRQTPSSALYQATMDRMAIFTQNGWAVKYIWEGEYVHAIRAGRSVASVLRTHDPDVVESPL